MKYIGLDWDGVVGDDVETWGDVVRSLSRRNKVFIVTARFDDEKNQEIHDFCKKYGIEAVFCSAQPKVKITDDMQLTINIWIDDMPELLFSKVEI